MMTHATTPSNRSSASSDPVIRRSGVDDPTGRRRQIAVINSNSSELVTAQLADTAAPWLLPGTVADFVNPDQGPRGIDTRYDLAVAAVETAALVRRSGEVYDAYVVACGNDPGLAASRECTSRPVVGIAEAGFLEACGRGERFSVAVLAPAKAQGMRALVRSYGLESRLSGIIAADSSSAVAAADPDGLLEQLTTACVRAGREELGDALVLTGSVMGRIADPLAAAIGIPVISGFLAGIRLAESLAERVSHVSETSSSHAKGNS